MSVYPPLTEFAVERVMQPGRRSGAEHGFGPT
jgi:hypothetical protein